MSATLRCTRCERELPDEAFARNRNATARRGRSYWCRECKSERNRAHRARPRACEQCGEPTPSREARLCNACRPGHLSGVTRDRRRDRFGEPYWTPDRMLAAIREYAHRHGRPPTANGWARPGRTAGPLGVRRRRWPPSSVVAETFGSWNAAIEAAGFTPRRRGSEERETCYRGHPLDAENVYRDGAGVRRCRVCRRETQRVAARRYRERRRTEAA